MGNSPLAAIKDAQRPRDYEGKLLEKWKCANPDCGEIYDHDLRGDAPFVRNDTELSLAAIRSTA